MFGVKKRRRRRSELRLGLQASDYQSTTLRPSLSITPVLKLWQLQGPKISGIVALLLLMLAFYMFFTNPAFFVYSAEIKGNVAISAREIYTASGVDSQSVFWLNPVRVATNVGKLPNIKWASVSIALPAQIVIEVVERRPQLVWQTGETLWWVDEEGTIVPPKADIDEEMLRIIDEDRQPLEVGYELDPSIIKGAQALRILAPNLSVVRYTRAQGLIVATPEGWPVYLGDGSNMRAKLVVLSGILPEVRASETDPAYIDLRNPLRPVYKPLPVIQMEPPTAQTIPVPPVPSLGWSQRP
jgi:cell division protein FtsQ